MRGLYLLVHFADLSQDALAGGALAVGLRHRVIGGGQFLQPLGEGDDTVRRLALGGRLLVQGPHPAGDGLAELLFLEGEGGLGAGVLGGGDGAGLQRVVEGLLRRRTVA